jgi:hypothetical protein
MTDISASLERQLVAMHERAIKFAIESAIAKEQYQEARLFVDRAAERLDKDHPLHPLNVHTLDKAYMAALAQAFSEQDLEATTTDPEVQKYVGMEDVILPDDYNGFDVNKWNEEAFTNAGELNELEHEQTQTS